MVLTFNPLLPRLSWFKKLGDFERGLFEFRDKPRTLWLVRASSAAPTFLKQHRKQAVGGSLFFGFFLLAKQKKETRLEAKKSITLDLWCANKHQFAHPTSLKSIQITLKLFCAAFRRGNQRRAYKIKT